MSEPIDQDARKQRVGADILRLAPTAVTYVIYANVDGGAGWRLYHVTLADGTDIDDGDAFKAIDDAVEEDLSWINWGAFGDRDRDDYLTIDVHTGRWLRDNDRKEH